MTEKRTPEQIADEIMVGDYADAAAMEAAVASAIRSAVEAETERCAGLAEQTQAERKQHRLKYGGSIVMSDGETIAKTIVERIRSHSENPK